MAEINWKVNKEDCIIITAIARRAIMMSKKADIPPSVTVADFDMDIPATHLNGCPLKLYNLLEADDFNFAHDVFGIRRHLDRNTGKLEHCFLPRYSV